MRFVHLASLLLFASFAGAARMAAQPSYPPFWTFGGNLSLDYTLHRSFTPAPYGDAPAPVNGEGIGYTVGLMGARRISGDPRGATLLVHLGYGWHPGRFESASRTSNGIDSADRSVEVAGTHRADISCAMVMADVQLHVRLAGWRTWSPIRDCILGFELGPSVGYLVSGIETQTFAIDDPTQPIRLRDVAGYEHGYSGQDVSIDGRSISGASRWRLGIRAGVSFGYWTDAFSLTPSLSLDYALTPLVKGSAWKVHIIRLDLAFQPGYHFWQSIFGLPPEEESSPL